MMFPLDSGPTRHLNTTNNPVIPAAARACLDQEKARSPGSNTGSDQMYTGEVPWNWFWNEIEKINTDGMQINKI